MLLFLISWLLEVFVCAHVKKKNETPSTLSHGRSGRFCPSKDQLKILLRNSIKVNQTCMWKSPRNSNLDCIQIPSRIQKGILRRKGWKWIIT